MVKSGALIINFPVDNKLEIPMNFSIFQDGAKMPHYQHKNSIIPAKRDYHIDRGPGQSLQAAPTHPVPRMGDST